MSTRERYFAVSQSSVSTLAKRGGMGGPDVPNDYYSVLGVDRTAERDEVRRAFRRRAAKAHPDKASPDQKKQATETFQHLSKAADILSDSAVSKNFGSGTLFRPRSASPAHDAGHKAVKKFDQSQLARKGQQARAEAFTIRSLLSA